LPKKNFEEITSLIKDYETMGDIEIEECKGLYQTKQKQKFTNIDASKEISNILLGNSEGRGISSVGRKKGNKVCEGDEIKENNGQISQGNVHYVNSKYLGFASLKITKDTIIVTYKHVKKDSYEIADETYTVNISKKLRKKFLKK